MTTSMSSMLLSSVVVFSSIFALAVIDSGIAQFHAWYPAAAGDRVS